MIISQFGRFTVVVVRPALVLLLGALAVGGVLPATAAEPTVLRAPPSFAAAVVTRLAGALAAAIGEPVTAEADAAARSGQPDVLIANLRAVDTLGYTRAGLAAAAPMVLIGQMSLEWPDGDLAAAAKAGKFAGLRLAHDGPGSASARCAKQFAVHVQMPMALVAEAPASALGAKRADLACVSAAEAVPLARAGTVTAFVVAADERLPALWDVPTGGEVGLPLFMATSAYGLYVRNPALAAKANAGLQAFLADEANVHALAEAGAIPFPLTHRSIEAHQAFEDAAER